MFEELKNKIVEIFFDEWKYNKWFRLGIYDFINKTKLIIRRKSKYYCFTALLDNDNPFRVNTGQIVRIYISKSCFDKEIIRHINLDSLPTQKLDLIMSVCRKDKYHLVMKQVTYIEHVRIGDDILRDMIR